LLATALSPLTFQQSSFSSFTADYPHHVEDTASIWCGG
jgi:hypothetical protein